MHTTQLLRDAIALAKSRGFHVRQEWLDGRTGGACELAGKKLIFVDLSLSAIEQLGQVLAALEKDQQGIVDRRAA